MLKENEHRYTESERCNIQKKYVDVDKVMSRYWIQSPVFKEEWTEIHYAEYSRISKLIQKLNLLEVDEHNKRATLIGATENIIVRSDMNALYGISIEDELT